MPVFHPLYSGVPAELLLFIADHFELFTPPPRRGANRGTGHGPTQVAGNPAVVEAAITEAAATITRDELADILGWPLARLLTALTELEDQLEGGRPAGPPCPRSRPSGGRRSGQPGPPGNYAGRPVG